MEKLAETSEPGFKELKREAAPISPKERRIIFLPLKTVDAAVPFFPEKSLAFGGFIHIQRI